MTQILKIQYDKLSKIPADVLESSDRIFVYFNMDEDDSLLAVLDKLPSGQFQRVETYDSLKEFSTVSMKELLTLYAKRTVIEADKEYYKPDDPKLHAFLSKLSYPGVEEVCKNIDSFSSQFKAGRVTLKTPKPNFKKPYAKS